MTNATFFFSFCTGRETFLTPITWEDGWPIANGGNTITIVEPGLYNISRPETWLDEFTNPTDNETLQIGWYNNRTPRKQDYSLTERPGYLRIWGTPWNLTEPTSISAYFQKQVSLNTVWSTSLEFYPDVGTAVEAGTALWLDESSYQSLGIRLCEMNATDRYLVATAFTGTNNTQVVSFSLFLPLDSSISALYLLYVN